MTFDLIWDFVLYVSELKKKVRTIWKLSFLFFLLCGPHEMYLWPAMCSIHACFVMMQNGWVWMRFYGVNAK